MATNGSIKTYIGGSYTTTGLNLELYWSRLSTNVAANTSTIRVILRIGNQDIQAGLVVSARGGTTITIDGTTYTYNAPGTNVTQSGYWSTELGRKDIVIPHNADGTKTVNLAGYYPIAATLRGTYYSAVSVSGTAVLTAIPKPSIPTLSNDAPTLGDTITIYTNRTSTSNTHTLKYTLGTESGTIVEDLPTDYNWTLPLSLADGMPNAASLAGVITCETYNGTTLLGTATVAFTASVPATMVPIISNVTITEDVLGIAAQFLGYVQNKSRLAVDTTADGVYSSTISQVKVTIDGKNYIGDAIVSEPLTTAGTVAVTVLVTDSRGKTATTTTNVTVIPYGPPQISAFNAYRVDGSGTPSDDGTSVAIPINFTIASVNDKNTKAWALEYRVTGATTWTTLASGSVYTYDATYTNLTGLFSIENSYDIRLTLTDYFASIERSASINTAFAIFNIRPTGKGIAFGKVSERDDMEIAMAAYFENGIYNADEYRVDTGNALPAGDGSVAYWANIPQGRYYVAAATITGQPETTGMIDLIRYGTNFIVTWHTLPSGSIYEMTGNNTSVTAWSKLWSALNLADLMGSFKKNLYTNASGTNSTISLAETAANFAYLDIYSIDNDGIANFTRVYSPDGKSVRLGGAVVTSAGRIYIKVALIAISGTSVSFTQNKHSAQSADANAYIRSDGATDGAYQKIIRIDGWIA